VVFDLIALLRCKDSTIFRYYKIYCPNFFVEYLAIRNLFRKFAGEHENIIYNETNSNPCGSHCDGCITAVGSTTA
jgi:hypothetical protein